MAQRINTSRQFLFKQHFLYFFPLPHGHGAFLPIFLVIPFKAGTFGGIDTSIGTGSFLA
jgi:hypothetical protein